MGREACPELDEGNPAAPATKKITVSLTLFTVLIRIV